MTEYIRRVCVDCGASFVIDNEQMEHLMARGFHNVPRRCKRCRALRREVLANNHNEPPRAA